MKTTPVPIPIAAHVAPHLQHQTRRSFAFAVSSVGARHAVPERATRTRRPSTHRALQMFCLAFKSEHRDEWPDRAKFSPGTACRALLTPTQPANVSSHRDTTHLATSAQAETYATEVLLRWEPSASAEGAGLQSSEKASRKHRGFSHGRFEGPALKRETKFLPKLRSAEALLPHQCGGSHLWPSSKEELSRRFLVFLPPRHLVTCGAG